MGLRLRRWNQKSRCCTSINCWGTPPSSPTLWLASGGPHLPPTHLLTSGTRIFWPYVGGMQGANGWEPLVYIPSGTTLKYIIHCACVYGCFLYLAQKEEHLKKEVLTVFSTENWFEKSTVFWFNLAHPKGKKKISFRCILYDAWAEMIP